ncbi:glutathione-disulfide reductase [Halotalea alkalilenta]|uniref:Glutathione-disulfide reductase n=1 Tax=Halotalea alkalilenta TaxID=376489 RepID=A0A172YG87_9GAMM|nr:glutathione-disulfide reductase [Halotalea alkalilenta]ANF58217.1 glutathione-disulfide reductase [Halotalea alkalilenta]
MAKHDYDLVVIGGGSGGVRAARMAAKQGARVALAEQSRLGGTCVNVGCVPKKLYAYASHFATSFRQSEGFGWSLSPSPSFEWSRLRDNTAREIERLNGIYRNLLVNAGVELFEAHAFIEGPHLVRIGEHRVSAERILIATGGKPWRPDFPGAERMLDSNRIFSLERLPRRLAIYGGGYIAVEFASIFSGLGVEVTLVYRGELFLRGFDHEVREFVRDEMMRKGVDFRFGHSVARIEASEQGDRVVLDDGAELEVDLVLGATGRRPNFDGLGLENLEVVLGEGGVLEVDDGYRTATPSVLALGDVIGTPELTPVAIAEAMRLVAIHFEHTAPAPIDYQNVATAVFCEPNVATVGLTEEQARERCEAVRIYVTKFRPMLHTLADDPGRCLMKLVVDDGSDKVVGAHMVGHDAGELIQGIAIAVTAGLTKADFDSTIGIHPTSAEEFVTLREATRR